MYTHPLYHWPPKSKWTELPSQEYTWNKSVAYIHFPFCRNICDFCGYETRLIDRDGVSNFGIHLGRQIDRLLEVSDLSEASLDAIFFGGGTASLMPSQHLADVISKLKRFKLFGKNREITLECEPGTISRNTLAEAKAAGVNRIGVCAQSFDDDILNRIGRKHNSEDSYKLIDDCLAVGFTNIHVDLMYGLPGQEMTDWEKTLQTTLALPIQHISAYKLYVFKHGIFNRQNISKRAEYEQDKETTYLGLMHDLTLRMTKASGFNQYSLTEFARPGKECRYVTSCFDGNDVIPLGPSAFGRCGNEVWDNSPYYHLYNNDNFGREHDRALLLSPAEAFKRDVLLGFWILKIDTDALCAIHKVTVSDDLLVVLDNLAKQDWITLNGRTISLSPEQRFLVGVPMQQLADLPASSWCEPNSINETFVLKQHPTKLTQRRLELNSIVRMARRDPKLFSEINSEPINTLKRIGFDVSGQDARTIINAITNQDGKQLTLDEEQLKEIWALVRNEHLRGKKAQENAGLI